MLHRSLVFFATLIVLASPNPACQAQEAIEIKIDARDLQRKLVDAELVIPVQDSSMPQTIALWYPKWVPGSHGPGGPIANIGGLVVTNASGESLKWKRTPGEVYRIEVELPAGDKQIFVKLRYITNQPTTNSFGHDCFGSQAIGLISPSCLMLVPEDVDIDETKASVRLAMPVDWQCASALPKAASNSESESVHFQHVTLRTLADSPIMIGAHYQTFELAAESALCPQHVLHVFADTSPETNLNPEIIDRYREMVKQAALLLGSHPFDRFDILLGVTDKLPKNGLEHARSTFNILPPRSLRSPATLKGWDRLLVPHEYIHAWCGKYRRPQGMLTSNFHQPKATELLWVYEGLTQYLGELVEARSGLMSAQEFRNRLYVELRNATFQQGRRWRSLVDTCSASHILRDGSPNWSGLRRSQDYYMEGMLFWIEADAIIRKHTRGVKSLDDFCHAFFDSQRENERPNPYSRQDIVALLSQTCEFDWDGLISRRIESVQSEFDYSLVDLLGYEFIKLPASPAIPSNTFRKPGGIDLMDSLGCSLGSDGSVRRVLLGSFAHSADLSVGDVIVGVGEFRWNSQRLLEAMQASQKRQPIDLLIGRGDRLLRRQIPYFDGPQHWNLRQAKDAPDVLEKILKPK